jgi:ATP phosphoribosyltransferase
VPKGRLLDSALAALAAARCPLDVRPRDYHPRCPDETLRPFLLKPRSVPAMLAHGLLDAGFCGRDLVLESGYEDRLEVAADLGTQRVRLCVAAADPRLLEAPPRRPLVIATEFPGLADRWATGRGLAHICVNTWGSTEAWVPEYADLCLDVVETGETLAANGLAIIDTLLESTTCLVIPRGGAARHHRALAALGGRA